jgi:Flp pilus assembly pilin Flp
MELDDRHARQKGMKGKRVRQEFFKMKNLGTLIRDLHNDRSGAAFIEYTVLIGIILAVSIGLISAIGLWANTQWTALNTAVNP